MPRECRHIQEYEKEIIELYNQGKTLREIGNQLGFTYKQVRDFKTRYNKKQRMIDAGKEIHKKGSPCKSDNGIPPSIQKLDTLFFVLSAQLGAVQLNSRYFLLWHNLQGMTTHIVLL